MLSSVLWIVFLVSATPLVQSFLPLATTWKNNLTNQGGLVDFGEDRYEANTNNRKLVPPLLALVPPLKPLFSFPPMDDDDIRIGGRDIIDHVKLLHDSLKKLTGRGLCERMGISDTVMDSNVDTYNNICLNDRFVLVSHGIQEDPVYNFSNQAGLEAFVRSWDQFIKLPSRQSVVFQSFDEELRIKLMKRVTDDGYVEGASGIRVRGDDKFIRLVDAVVSVTAINLKYFLLSLIMLRYISSPTIVRYGIAMTEMAFTVAKQHYLIEKNVPFFQQLMRNECIEFEL